MRVLSAKETHEALNLLAVIHGDGGHHETAYGFEKSARDAIDKVIETNATLYAYQAVVDAAFKYRSAVKVLERTQPQTEEESDAVQDGVADAEIALFAALAAIPDEARADTAERGTERVTG